MLGLKGISKPWTKLDLQVCVNEKPKLKVLRQFGRTSQAGVR